MLVDLLCRWWILVACHDLAEDASVLLMTVVQKGVHLLVMQDIVHQLIQHVGEQSLVFSGFNWIIIFDLLKYIITKVVTYEFGSFLQPKEQELLVVVHVGVGMHALEFSLVFVSLVVPLN